MIQLEHTKDLATSKNHPLQCPKCFSVFIVDHCCQSCGFDLKRTWNKEDILKNNFYLLRDNYDQYYKNLFYRRCLYFFSSRHSQMYKNYSFKLSRRFQFLVNYLVHRSDTKSLSGWPLSEFQDLSSYMASLGLLKTSHFRYLDKLKPDIKELLSGMLSTAKQKASSETKEKGSLKMKLLVLAIFFYSIISLLSIRMFHLLYL